ncbi:MAG: hypothetical protein R3281_03940 [Balneolaceae bacterium]|nr:hypothetical protein [Balneolaceae bacterium]
MSKQEILAWTSLTTSVSIVFFYVLFVYGWPDFLPDYSDQFVEIFFNVFWIAVVAEIIVGISENKKRVDKDERDFMIEAHGLKNAYNFLSFAVAVLLVNFFISGLLSDISELHGMIGTSTTTFHLLFIVLFASNIIKRTTQIYHYHKEF